jgi:hypothetical protein
VAGNGVCAQRAGIEVKKSRHMEFSSLHMMFKPRL